MASVSSIKISVRFLMVSSSRSITGFIILIINMRFALTFALPSILLLQSIAASPAWMRSEHDVCEALYDADPGKLGAVASESSICSNIGIDILRCGGNAADSLVATVLCIGVVGMYHSGIGGGGFMLVRSSNGTFENIDFRETAPAAAFERMYNKNTVSIYDCATAFSVAVADVASCRIAVSTAV